MVAEPVISDAIDVRVSNEEIIVFLLDGRTISIPLEWYPRLLHATAEERMEWELIGGGDGIHWANIDEDVQVRALIYGFPSRTASKKLKIFRTTYCRNLNHNVDSVVYDGP